MCGFVAVVVDPVLYQVHHETNADDHRARYEELHLAILPATRLLCGADGGQHQPSERSP